MGLSMITGGSQVDKQVRQGGTEACPARLVTERNAPEPEAGLRVPRGQAAEGLTQTMH